MSSLSLSKGRPIEDDEEPDVAPRRTPMKDIVAPEFETNRLCNGLLEHVVLVRVVLDDGLKARLWPRLTREHFASDTGVATFDRLYQMQKTQRDWPSLSMLAMDPALPPDAQAQLQAVVARSDRGLPLTHGVIDLGPGIQVPLETSADFEGHAYDLLEAYRYTRSGLEYFTDVTKTLADAEKFDPFTGPGLVEKAALAVLALKGKEALGDAIIHFGHKTTDEDAAKRQKEIDKLFAADKPRFKTGFAAYDQKAGGLQPGEVCLLASGTGMGKTAMSLSMMANMARSGTSVAQLQLELTLQQITERVSANLANIDSELIRKGGDNLKPAHQKRIREAWDEFDEELRGVGSRFTIFAPSSCTVQQCEYVFKTYPYRVWFIDYVNLVKLDDSKKEGWEKLQACVQQFKALAKKYQIAIVICCQVNVDKETGQVEIRYAKAMSEDADVIMYWLLNQEARDEGVVWVKHMKARQYEPFDFPMRVVLNYCRFESFTPSDAPAPRTLSNNKKAKVEERKPGDANPFQRKKQPIGVAPKTATSTTAVQPPSPKTKRPTKPAVVAEDDDRDLIAAMQTTPASLLLDDTKAYEEYEND